MCEQRRRADDHPSLIAGIHRPHVQELQRQGLIAYHRGSVTVLDRAGLEQAACPCYARQHLAYQALLR